ncbi:MAG: SAF domain-containing protein [Propionibacteriaceae bacterium]|nr:SAF domain-containing protein [Propionibacteriaceae bacterium]
MKAIWNPAAILRVLRWHRRAIAVVASLICLFSGLGMALAPQPTGTPVVVTTRALPPGSLLVAGDVRVVQAPADLIPSGALTSAADAVGATLAVGLPQGAMLTSWALSAADALTDQAAGEVLVPFHLADASVAPLLRAGTHLTIVATQPDGGTWVVARHVRVATPPAEPGSGVLGSTTTSGVMVLVAADPATGQALAGASGSSLGVMIEDS